MAKGLGWINLQPTGKCDGHVHNNFARAAHSLVHIFAVIAGLRRERFIEDVNTTTTFSFSFFLNLGADPRIQAQRSSPTYNILSELEEKRQSLQKKNESGWVQEAAFCSSFHLFLPPLVKYFCHLLPEENRYLRWRHSFVTNKSGEGNILVLN